MTDLFGLRCTPECAEIPCACHLFPEAVELTRAKQEYDAAIGLVVAWRVVRDAARGAR